MDAIEFLEHELDPIYVEQEGHDVRFDFKGDISLWIRDGIMLEGSVPADKKEVLAELIQEWGLDASGLYE